MYNNTNITLSLKNRSNKANIVHCLYTVLYKKNLDLVSNYQIDRVRTAVKNCKHVTQSFQNNTAVVGREEIFVMFKLLLVKLSDTVMLKSP